MPRAQVVTFGCKTNQYEGEVLRQRLAAMGYRPADGRESPVDLTVVNTCTVTVRADRKCRQLIRRIAREHPGVPIYVTGCYVRRSPADLSTLDGVVAVCADRDELLRVIARNERPEPPAAHADAPTPSRRSRAMLQIQDGCDAFCTFCIVPHVRPTLRSKPIDHVLEEARRLVAAGFREIVLTGIHLGRYGADRDDGVTPAEVIRRVAETEGLARLRLSSIEMFDVADDLIDVMADSPVICPHLHLPLQSGDDDVLAAMNRRYTAADVVEAVRRIRTRLGHVAVTTDVIAGFPGETETAFQNTLDLCREIGFSKMHVFPYSVRPGTAAATLAGHLPAHVVTERKKRLIALGDELALACKQRFVNETVEVLVEESRPQSDGRFLCAGLTADYMRVRFPCETDRSNQIVPVTVESVTPEVMHGRAHTTKAE